MYICTCIMGLTRLGNQTPDPPRVYPPPLVARHHGGFTLYFFFSSTTSGSLTMDPSMLEEGEGEGRIDVKSKDSFLYLYVPSSRMRIFFQGL